MMVRFVLTLVVVSIVQLKGAPASAAPWFDTPVAGGCSRDGYRSWAAIITGDFHGDWLNACKATSATIGAVSYPSRDCAWVTGRVWGKFDVPDRSCATEIWFETPKKDQCTTDGKRQWSAIVTGRHYTGDWVAACKSHSATINGVAVRPRQCGWNGGKVWGEFSVDDDTCATKLWFEQPVRGECSKRGAREWNAIITGSHYTGDWVAACNVSRAQIGSATWPSRSCGWNAGRVWGKFDVEDASCIPRWTGPSSAGCSYVGKRSYVANLTGTSDFPTDCQNTPNTVNGIQFAHPSRCIANGEEGQFDVPDAGCQPRFGTARLNECDDTSLRKYSAPIVDVPSHESAVVLCNSKRWSVVVDNKSYPPATCVYGVNETIGIIKVPDRTCGASGGGAGGGGSDCVAFKSVRVTNTSADDFVVWFRKASSNEYVSKGHLASQLSKTFAFEEGLQLYDVLVVDVAWVAKRNKDNFDHHVTIEPVYDADAANPDVGAVFQPDKFVAIQTSAPLPGCSKGQWLYDLNTSTAEATTPARSSSELRPKPSILRKRPTK